MSAEVKRKLGRGLESLLPSDFNPDLLLSSEDRIQKLPIKNIQPNPKQPRRHFDEQALAELSSSIKRYGVLQPIIVAPIGQGGYQIIAGERRWRAAKQAGLEHMPAIVRDQAEIEKLEIALIENIQRVDLSPLEQALSIERLHSQFNISYQDIAHKLGKAATTVNNIVRLLQLPKDAQAALAEGRITEGHARAILSLKHAPQLQTELLKSIQSKNWSVRQAEQFVIAHRRGEATKQTVKRQLSAETVETKELSRNIGHKVSIKRLASGGKLEIHFKDEADLKKLYRKLSG